MQPQSIFVTRVWRMCERIWGADERLQWCVVCRCYLFRHISQSPHDDSPLLLDALPTET